MYFFGRRAACQCGPFSIVWITGDFRSDPIWQSEVLILIGKLYLRNDKAREDILIDVDVPNMGAVGNSITDLAAHICTA